MASRPRSVLFFRICSSVVDYEEDVEERPDEEREIAKPNNTICPKNFRSGKNSQKKNSIYQYRKNRYC